MSRTPTYLLHRVTGNLDGWMHHVGIHSQRFCDFHEWLVWRLVGESLQRGLAEADEGNGERMDWVTEPEGGYIKPGLTTVTNTGTEPEPVEEETDVE